MENSLRQELRELADVEPPTGLADRTLSTARQRRRQRWSVGGGGVAALIVVVAAAIALTGNGAPRPHRAPAKPEVIRPAGKDRQVVAMYTVQNRQDTHEETWVLNPSTGRYGQVRRVAGERLDSVMFSPDGHTALVELSGLVHPERWALIPVAALAAGHDDQLRWLPRQPVIYGHNLQEAAVPSLLEATASWSHDGSKVLLLVNVGHSLGFQIYDMRSGQLGPAHRLNTLSSDTLLSWGRNDNEIALSPATQAAKRAKSKTVRLFSAANGKPTGQLRLPDSFNSDDLRLWGAGPTSPDGHYATATKGDVMDLATRKVIPLRSSDRSFFTWTISWYDNQHYVVFVDQNTLELVNVKGQPERSLRLPISTPEMPTGLPHSQIQGSLNVHMAPASAFPAGSGIRF